MASRRDEPAIQEATRRLVDQFHPSRIILFGSQARGQASPDSDVDLIVLFDQEAGIDVALTGRMHESLRGIRLAFDLVPMSVSQFSLHSQIVGTLAYPAAREGRVLYQRAA